MLGKIIGFELRYRFKKPMTYIFMAMMLFQAIWYVKGTYDYYVNDATYFNAAGIVYEAMAGGGMLMIIAIAVITGTALFKDLEFKTAETFYSYPVKDKTWMVGKFVAAYLINLSIVVVYAIGFTIVQYTGLAGPEKFGPVPWGHIMYGFLLFSIPNMFIITMISLSMVVFFRNIASSYLGVFLLTMMFIMAEASRENAGNITLIYLFDPFGFTFTKDAIDLLPVAMKNTAYYQLSGIYWANRAVWIGMALIITFFAFRKFSFKYFLAKPVKKNRQFAEEGEVTFAKKVNRYIHKTFGTGEYLKKLFRLSALELKNTVRPVGFKIVCGLLALMFFGYNYLWNAEYYIHTDTLPITSMMTFTRLPNGVFMLIILAVFAGELLFKERSNNVWQLTDTLPVPSWVTYFSKFLAMVVVAFIFALLLFISGIIAQVLQGYYAIEWNVYFNDLFAFHFGWVNYLFVIALAFFMGSVTANRFSGHIVTVAILFFVIVFADIGVIEQVRYVFSFTPGIEDYSEMNGYGVYGDAAGWYAIMWGLLCLALLFFGLWFWNRGSIQSIEKRLAILRPQLHMVGKIAAIALLSGFFYMQHYVVANDHDLGNFKTDDQQDAEDAGYEKLFKYIEDQNHPFVCGLDVTIDIVPGKRQAHYTFNMQLTNRAGANIDTLHFNTKDFVNLHSLKMNGIPLSPTWENNTYGQYAYTLPQPMHVGDTIDITGNCSLQYVGFCTNDPQRALVYNGSFLEEDIVPHIGYNSDKELEENRTRGAYGLEKLASRMEPVDNARALREEALSPHALRHRTTLRVRTANGQTAYASGAYRGTETIQGKQYAVYNTEKPFAMKWYIGTARYEEFHAELKNGIDLKILYDARHAYNLEPMKEAAEDGISFLAKNLGPYPYTQLTISEIPFYNDNDFYTAPDAIAISEKHCWTADGKREKDLSYIYYAICREEVAQWVQQNKPIADVQGADMLLKAIPEAYALWYVKDKFGEAVLQVYLDKKEERYGKGRGNESNVEPPLIYADGADYLEVNKGAMELYHVMTEMGIGKFSELLTTWNAESQGENLVFKDFYRLLLAECDDNQSGKMKHAFEEVL